MLQVLASWQSFQWQRHKWEEVRRHQMQTKRTSKVGEDGKTTKFCTQGSSRKESCMPRGRDNAKEFCKRRRKCCFVHGGDEWVRVRGGGEEKEARREAKKNKVPFFVLCASCEPPAQTATEFPWDSTAAALPQQPSCGAVIGRGAWSLLATARKRQIFELGYDFQLTRASTVQRSNERAVGSFRRKS